MAGADGDEKLRLEFNEWAEEGKGEEMEQHHASIVEPTIAMMNLKAGERVLDLGCGAGWATRLLARQVAGGEHGQAVGLDISDEMIARARTSSKGVENAMYVWGSAQEIPWQEEYFDKVLSVESFYYYTDQSKVLEEVLRVLAPGGAAYILINLYKDNPYSLRWVDELKVPVHARSEAEYVEMMRQHGFEQVEARRVPDESPTPETYSGRWFKNAEELRDFKRMGALLLVGRKKR